MISPMSKRKTVSGEVVPRKTGTGMGLDAPKNQALRARVHKALTEQHPIHALFGTAFEEVGGIERLCEWAEDNYSDFIRIFSKMAPAAEKGTGKGKIQIQINNQLGPSSLDE